MVDRIDLTFVATTAKRSFPGSSIFLILITFYFALVNSFYTLTDRNILSNFDPFLLGYFSSVEYRRNSKEMILSELFLIDISEEEIMISHQKRYFPSS